MEERNGTDRFLGRTTPESHRKLHSSVWACGERVQLPGSGLRDWVDACKGVDGALNPETEKRPTHGRPPTQTPSPEGFFPRKPILDEHPKARHQHELRAPRGRAARYLVTVLAEKCDAGCASCMRGFR